LGLLEAGASVVAIEIDPALAALLPEIVAHQGAAQTDPAQSDPAQTETGLLGGLDSGAVDRLAVLVADALAVQPAVILAAAATLTPQSGQPTALVANLPYNIAVPVVLRLWSMLPSLRHGLVLVQAEVAQRLAADPGSKVYGVPSAKAAWFADVRRAGTVGRPVFWPAPNVDSELVSMVRRDPPPSGDATRAQVFALIDAAFSQRRKMLRSVLAGWAGSSDRATAMLVEADIDPQRRGETLSIAEFARLAAVSVRA
jgi:16S rRNA (adenine1518-N6/adenine1519-N6)-dimethyltransferase